MRPHRLNEANQDADVRSTGEAPFGIAVPPISLPQGGGALKGIDEKFEVNPANGTAALSLPLPFSPARDGFMPALALAYNSGYGNSIFGLGWSLGFPSVQRKTDQRLPRYEDESDSDTFVFSGAEDLVPALTASGEAERLEADGFIIRPYRPRIEGGFARIERIEHPERGIWWRVTDPENTTTFFGKSPDFRIADPNDEAKVFQWLPELSYDAKGNCVLYEFKAEDGAGYGAALYDANRFDAAGRPRFANRYLKRVRYAPRSPFRPADSTSAGIYSPDNPAAEDFLMELAFDYGEHGPLPERAHGDATVSYAEQAPWGIRSDAFSAYRAGFEIRTARLCQRVLMYHHFEELGANCLVRSLDLHYRDWDLREAPETGKKLEVTYLASATQRSYLRNEGDRYRFQGLPPMEFGYQELEWDTALRSIAPEDAVHAPVGLSGGYQWLDLYHEGLPGILCEQGEAWHYQENLGNGRFAPARPVIPKPSLMGLDGGVLQLQDLGADGRRQVVVNSPGLNGYFELGMDNGWENFRAFEQIPNVDLQDANTRLLDLDGDGRPEIVITEEQAFTWYPSAGFNGYDAPELAPKPFDEEQGPAVVFSDSAQRIFLADMSGDGLTDIVRIRNGEACYWPNLGYGRFGTKVAMAGSPWFDAPEQFNPSYLQLADVSGTGTTDLVYLGKNRFCAWLNRSGNAWSEACEIEPFFDTAQPMQLSVTDLLGNGTACIVWSSPLPGHADSPLRYIDLMGGRKPHVLNTYRNNLGMTTRWAYRSSTHFYLEDKQAGRPWITKLPFPVQVVSQVVTEDQWRNTRFANRYTYHHGYYDHAEREFRGFGRVEQTDTEDFGIFAAANSASPYITADQRLYQPPVRTITWFHTGAFLGRTRILQQYAEEYFRPNGSGFYENELPEPSLDDAGWSAGEYCEALRACKGMALRTEVYELALGEDGQVSEQRAKYFSAAFHNCHIQRLQGRGPNPHSVFLVTESEAITYHYEMPLHEGRAVFPADPRIAHTLNLRTDEYGNVLESVAVAYPRWQDEPQEDTLLPEGAAELIRDVQREMHLAYTESLFTNDIIAPAGYRLRLPCEVRTYELSGLRPGNGRYFSLQELREARITEAVPAIPYHALLNPDEMQKRLVEQARTLYFDEGLSGPLPWGQINRLALPYEQYQKALTEGLLSAVLGEQLPLLQQAGEDYPAMLERVLAEGGYHRFADEPDAWWIRSGIAGFAAGAANRFFLPDRYTDAFGNTTRLGYDGYLLFPQRTIDPLGNQTEVLRFNYRVLAPEEIRDPNLNLTEAAFDVLGMPVAIALKGKGEEGDSLRDVPLEIASERLIRFFTGDYDEAEARALLGSATARHLYYLGEEQDADGSIRYGNHPACAAGLMREVHLAQGGEASPLQAGFEYSDGMGAVLVTKSQAEPDGLGGPLRWIATGKTVLNNKGNPVKQYEPYFSPSGHRFDEPIETGVTPIFYYDAAGRQLRTELPDGTINKVEFSPWFMAAYDANDTVLDEGNAWYARHIAPMAGTAHQRAARLSAEHAETPAVTALDSLAREVVAIVHNGSRRDDGEWRGEKYITYTKLDAEGKPLWIQDARGNRVMEYINRPGAETGYAPGYDIAGNLLFQHSMEGGNRWMLMDALGQPLYAWDVNERALEDGSMLLENRLSHTIYDGLRRPVEQQLHINGEAPAAIERFIYGESHSEAEARNLRGQVYQHYGPSGLMANLRFDFKGNLLEAARQFVQSYAAPVIDWNTETPSAEIFTQRTEYDALSRMARLENWHLEGRAPAIYRPRYNERGALQSETLTVRGEEQEAISHIEYDAKGQHTRLRLGNGTTTRYSYDPLSFRLTNLRTTGQGGTVLLQDLHYTYDAVGNIAQIEDLAQDEVFFRNAQIKPIQTYEYDALYRLIQAEGREQAGHPAQGPGPYPFGPMGSIPGDGSLRHYTQRYAYDAVGNFTQMRHIANGGSWTRHYETASDSNRLLRTWRGDDEVAAVRYDYDTHGSMLNLANTPDAYRLRRDYRDMIHTANLGGGGQAYYNYDSAKQRTRKRIERNGSRIEERLYLGGMELYRRWENGALTEAIETHHLFADDQRALMVEDVLSTNNPRLAPGVLFRYQYGNHLGSAALELDHEAAIISYEEYHPYGTTAYQAHNANLRAAAKRYRYTGMERDEETGLSYHTARYYLPWLGRWGSVDPIGVGDGVNVYFYARGNPVAETDVSGTQSLRLTAPVFGGQAWRQYQRIVNSGAARGGAERSRSHVGQESLDTLMLGVSEYSERDAQIEFQLTIEEIISENQPDIFASAAARSAPEQPLGQRTAARVLASPPTDRQEIVRPIYDTADLEGVAAVQPYEAQQRLRLTLRGGFSDGPVSLLDRIRFEWRNTIGLSDAEANTSVRMSIRAFNLEESEERSALEVGSAFQVWVNFAPTGASFLMRLDIIKLSGSGMEARLSAELTGSGSGLGAQIRALMGYENELVDGVSLSFGIETGIGVNSEGEMEVSLGGELGLKIRLPNLN